MPNATTRAHVASPTTPPATIPARSTPKNIPTPTPDHTDTDTDTDKPPIPTPPTSRREKRKSKKHALPTPPDTENERETTAAQRPQRKPRGLAPPPTMTSPKAAQKAFSLLICSIGNPGPTYANTLHSAGHTIIREIAMRKQYKPFAKGLSGMVSHPDNTVFTWSLTGYTKSDGGPPEDDWTFWQSTSLMNVSGVGVKRAYAEWLRGVKAAGGEGRLVVVHDELEGMLGKVSVRESWVSARGHNGLKSIQGQMGGVKWWRVGVGIGRPESRDPKDVSRHVLRKMTDRERTVLEKSAVGVVDALRSIAEGSSK